MNTIQKVMLGTTTLCLFACDGGDTKAGDQAKASVEAAAKPAPEAAPTAPTAPDAEGKQGPEAHDQHAAHEHHEAAPAEKAEVEAGARVEISVDAAGYHPAEIVAPPKSKVTLAFTRANEQNCGQKLVIADMKLEKDLPVGESVEIEVEVPESGALGFACGMNMYKGKVSPKS